MSNNILSYLGWTFLPNFLTTNLQSFYYSLTLRAGSPKPQPGTPIYALHRRRIHIAVILTYLLYTLYEADWDVRRAGDFYADLGVPHDVEEKAIGSRFRRLTLLYHPDKLTDATVDRAAAEARYVHLKLARDTLMDPAKRFAYDRFGPDIVGWRECSTVGEFVMRGMKALVPFYAGSTIVLIGMGWLGFFEWGRYWRYLAFASLALFELHTITRPYFPLLTLLPTLLNPLSTLPLPLSARAPYLPFQILRIAHKATITLFIALNQLGPLVQPGSSTGLGTSSIDMQRQLQRLEQLVALNGVEAARLLGLEGAPFVVGDGRGGVVVDGEGAGAHDAEEGSRVVGVTSRRGPGLRAKVKEWFVTNAVRNDIEVREAVGSVVRRRTGEVLDARRAGTEN